MPQFDLYQNTLQSVDENGNVQTSFDIEQHTGFIIIKNAVLASAGVLEYAGHRLGLTGEDANKMFKVFQSEENLFNEINLKGANGVVVTEEHPIDQVVEIFDKGDFIQFGFTLERAKPIGKYLVNDIKITSANAIQNILNGRTLGFSPGYEVGYIKQMGVYKDGDIEITYDYVKDMKQINHIALTTSPRNKETIFTDKYDNNTKRKVMKKLFFQLQNGSTETITTDSIDEIIPLIVKQNQSIIDLEDALNNKSKLVTDSDDKVSELENKIKELQAQLEEEKKKTTKIAQKVENDSLLKDIKEFATTHQIKISNDSEDVVEILKDIIANDGIDTKELDLKSLKPMYQLLKKQNSSNTLDRYNTGAINDADDVADIEAQTRAYFNGGAN